SRLRTLNRFELRNGLPLLQGFSDFLRIVLFLLHLPRQYRFNSFGRLDTSGTHQLRGKVRVLCSQRIVRAFMQLNPVTTGSGKTLMCHRVETPGMLCERSMQDAGLFGRRLYVQNKCSIHTKRISYITPFCQEARENGKRENPSPHAPTRNAYFLPMPGRADSYPHFWGVA